MRPEQLLSLGLLLGGSLLAGAFQAVRAEPLKECAIDDQPIPCRDSHSSDGTVRIVWKDGQAMTYRLIHKGFPLSPLLHDSLLGGLWEREIFPRAMLCSPATWPYTLPNSAPSTT